MTKNYLSLMVLFIATAFTMVRAQDAPVLTFDLPAQNNIRYNRFLMNPTFSFVREKSQNISVYHRTQWIQFDDSPKVYLAAYTGKFAEKAGFGIGIYQQNIGVITSIGGVGNYAYNIRLREDMNLTLGANIAYYSSGVSKSRSVTESPDPVLLAMRDNSLISIKPGINLSYRRFDFGAYAENLVEYDLKSSGMVKDYSNKTYSGHIMYTGELNNSSGLLSNGMYRLIVGGQMDSDGFNPNGAALVDFPRLGWLQASMHTYYGIGAGAGFHLTRRLSLGYVYERSMKDQLVNLGPTHELTMNFNISKSIAEEIQTPKRDSLQEAFDDIELENDEESELKQFEFDKDTELAKLRKELDPESMYLLDVLVKEDSLATIQKAAFEKKVKNLMEYAQREQQTGHAQAKLRFNPETGALEAEPTADSIAANNTAETDKKAENPKKNLKKLNRLVIPDIKPGFYIIANVFSTQENTDNFISSLRSKGFKDAGYFVNPENGLMYVYLTMYPRFKQARAAYYSNMNKTYSETIWVGSVKNK